MVKELQILLNVHINKYQCLCAIDYDYYPAYDGHPLVEPDPPVIDIQTIAICDFKIDPITVIAHRWFKKHPGWTEFLMNIIYDKIMDVESSYYEQMLERGLE